MLLKEIYFETIVKYFTTDLVPIQSARDDDKKMPIKFPDKLPKRMALQVQWTWSEAFLKSFIVSNIFFLLDDDFFCRDCLWRDLILLHHWPTSRRPIKFESCRKTKEPLLNARQDLWPLKKRFYHWYLSKLSHSRVERKKGFDRSGKFKESVSATLASPVINLWVKSKILSCPTIKIHQDVILI